MEDKGFYLNMDRGKFVVVYGMNNLGKTTATKALVENLRGRRIPSRYLKYAIYELEPTGPRINVYLRGGNPEKLTPLQFQELQVQNRRDFEPQLIEWLEKGAWVVAEDYVGTGIAWGMTAGIPVETLEKMNRGLLVPDIQCLMDGKRFSTGREINHAHEGAEDLWQKGRECHLFLAKRYGWPIVHANQTREAVLKEIVSLMEGEVLGVEGNYRCKKER